MGANQLSWPAGMRSTRMRAKWFARLRTLPPNLTIKAIAARWGESYASAGSWAKFFGYAYRSLPRGRKARIDWKTVDWTQRNSDLARQLGVSGERVRQIRIERNIAPVSRLSEAGRMFCEYLQANRESLRGFSLRQMIAASGVAISMPAGYTILKQVGMQPRRRNVPWNDVNWRLSDEDLARIWEIRAAYVAKMRRSVGAGSQTNSGVKSDGDESSLQELWVMEERQKAADSRDQTARTAEVEEVAKELGDVEPMPWVDTPAADRSRSAEQVSARL